MRILFLGDVMGRPGREGVAKALPELRRKLEPDFVIVNAENASGGLGLAKKEAKALLALGIDVLTSGNHIWRHKDICAFAEREARLLRPANYPPGAPGRGWGVYEAPGGVQVAVANFLGRTFMDDVDCPFQAADAFLAAVPDEVRVRVVDMHAEATSEKKALAYHMDGAVSAVLGTHTHVPTADATVLALGTAYLTDAGMCGVQDSVIGMEHGPIIHRYLSGMPTRFTLARGAVTLQGVLISVDAETGRAQGIEPVSHKVM